ncbi:MAG: hypothetical protein ACXV2C_03550 [Candidatus Bathyarchaeia archaeon]
MEEVATTISDEAEKQKRIRCLSQEEYDMIVSILQGEAEKAPAKLKRLALLFAGKKTQTLQDPKATRGDTPLALCSTF